MDSRPSYETMGLFVTDGRAWHIMPEVMGGTSGKDPQGEFPLTLG